MRNKKAGLKPANQADIARRFGLSRMYTYSVIAESQRGPKSNEWRKKFAAYAGMEV
ncbi:MAG: XRE family transcriptional regulator [Ligilactobacillus animalis]|uniref:XRE family transcriptional regulator n=2 Tax=Ligilactobacillus TaxID=2767887 RepID=UPI002430B93F|nr:XRE family transcriptional regulator [Ligilactobacillus animalis]MCI5942687.1 XRE family transcriptional regulator [Ligilactobacillus animalis]